MSETAVLAESALDLAWSLWAELGVSSWTRRHQDWSIEVEPLMAYTAVIAPHDPRLAREAVDWCTTYEEFVSIHQFRHVVTAARWPFQGEVNDLTATLASRTKRRWPGAEKGTPYEFTSEGSSVLADLRRPSLVQLRLRALLGVSARAEIVRAMLTRSPREWSVRDIADRVAYTPRQLQGDLERLARAHVVQPQGDGKRLTYVLRNRDAWRAILGPGPAVAPRWDLLLRSVAGVLAAATALTTRQLAMPKAELSRQLRLLEPAFRGAGLEAPRITPVSDVDDFLEWATALLASLASGSAAHLRAGAA